MNEIYEELSNYRRCAVGYLANSGLCELSTGHSKGIIWMADMIMDKIRELEEREMDEFEAEVSRSDELF